LLIHCKEDSSRQWKWRRTSFLSIFCPWLYGIRFCLRDGLYYGVLRHREDTIKLFYDNVAKCVPSFTTIAAASDARNKRSRLSLQRLTFPSASFLLRVRVSVCDSLFLTLSIVAPQFGNVNCTNVMLNISERTKESDWFQNQRLHLGSKNSFTKIHKMSTSNKMLSLWNDIWSDSINTNDWKLPVCQYSYLII